MVHANQQRLLAIRIDRPRPLLVWNLGLPRTGTTSVTAALKRLGIRCIPVVAQWVAADIRRWGGFQRRIPGGHPPLICTRRDLPSWLGSAGRYFQTRADTGMLERVYQEHNAWLDSLTQVGTLDVRGGYEALFGALAVAHRGVMLPVLNESR